MLGLYLGQDQISNKVWRHISLNDIQVQGRPVAAKLQRLGRHSHVLAMVNVSNPASFSTQNGIQLVPQWLCLSLYPMPEPPTVDEQILI